MGKRQAKLSSRLINFISEQKLFFVGTAMEEGTINISPKGMDSLRVIDQNRVIWLNLTGSGNETATHLKNNSRMTLMFCAFDKKPLILRLYGTAKVHHQRDAEWKEHIGLFPEIPGARQLIDMQIELVQSSCGFGVPLMDYMGERHLLDTWAQEKGEEGLLEYRKQKNTTSLDGHPTGIFET
ncbi:pyridoxamine 5'-phosphate oxidase family protein [Poritiphilus flavus]|uniref:Pyridoxamine 5'-phosphate oxidase family protein n=1 Tax=Poritiphilus flavus TaxID=2697053 RepID=A0A6L9EBR1_9FLAO|nr:pyridoxamine 5'-phosphate oxidase family protein [Poritiphilus flavus]NAS11849.1 pyridoxamine 5'-phosphate oxidase family protein [Poritiphilus flavus]